MIGTPQERRETPGSPSGGLAPQEVQTGDEAGRSRSGQGRLARAALFAAVVAVLAAGTWGVFAPRNPHEDQHAAHGHTEPARVGEPVEVPGGVLQVDRVAPESIAPMQTGKFAGSRMNMSGMGVDMAPEGQRRLNVDVTLAGEGDDLRYSADDFRLTGEGMEDTGPIKHKLIDGVVPQGSAASGTLTFQVPEEASEVLLGFGDRERPVALDLPPAKGHEHGDSHGGSADEVEDGHSHSGS